MAKIVVFLQNAWSIIEMDEWPRERWLRALRRSYSGRRLNILLSEDWSDVHVDNTTRAVGVGRRSKLVPDTTHIATILTAQQPLVVVTCGKQAESAVTPLWSGRLLVLPHPAARVTANVFHDARGLLLSLLAGQEGRMALRQDKHRQTIREGIPV